MLQLVDRSILKPVAHGVLDQRTNLIQTKRGVRKCEKESTSRDGWMNENRPGSHE